jgi:ATP-dependent Lhr-like helicase
VAGRWSALPAREPDSTVRAHFTAELLMNRYGVLTRPAVTAEAVPGGFATLYKVLSAFEESGRCQRGYFVESLGGAQFAVAATVDRLRGYADGIDPNRTERQAVVLAAADPANPYGTALPWPAGDGGHRPGRKAGALVVLVDGELVWYCERGGRTLLSFSRDIDAQRAAAGALAELVTAGRVSAMVIEKIDGLSALEVAHSDTAEALLAAGFSRTPRGLRLR